MSPLSSPYLPVTEVQNDDDDDQNHDDDDQIAPNQGSRHLRFSSSQAALCRVCSVSPRLAKGSRLHPIIVDQ